MPLQTILIAFSMYSAIPMPHIDWNERNMRYVLCAFPLVGIVIGLVCWGFLYLCDLLGFPPLLRGAGLCLLPPLLTGGIHLDGYVDTWDALSSHAGWERRQEILKDPHIGAFAAIHLCMYFLTNWAICASLPEDVPTIPVLLLCMFCLSRTLSALSVLCFPLRQGSGLARSFAESANRRTSVCILFGMAVALSVFMTAWGGIGSLAMLLAAFLSFFLYYRMVRQEFGGLSGDLAGWFLQTAELRMLAVLCLWQFVANRL